ncbi:sigma-B regulation protein RsbU (phosphoserine phosphatase) [Granulicella rosea]|uniref:Sigma-B regulation protein RsbU (Phosphoserine phosphatase) n=1 Tax=Granulicella rosea TaxID=474952 RepID=A0A239DXF2_9BACT|nr:SpoIIE family protein phosphatase [Granulicella rosea]SNS36382.1 sigma-B regulation protein RsbU (phosphoserine phosphatase) [Granulicella rosea]
MTTSPYATLLRLLLALTMLTGLSFWGGSVRNGFGDRFHPEQFTRTPFGMDPDTHEVYWLQPEARAAGLPEHSRVELLNGVAYTGLEQWNADIADVFPGESVQVGYLRTDGSRHSASIRLVARRAAPPGSHERALLWQRLVLFELLPLFCMFVGYWVVFVKPDEPIAWLLLALLSVPIVLYVRPDRDSGAWLYFREFYYLAFQSFGPALLLPFGIYFPERSRIDRRAPWLKWVVLAPLTACASLGFYQTYARLALGGVPPAWIAFIHWASHIANWLSLLCVLLYLLLVADKVRTASSQDARRRLRVLLTGTAIGLGAPLFVLQLMPALGYSPNHNDLWLRYLTGILFLLLPFTLAYTVVVQRAMDVRFLLRLGTRYALARASIWAVQALLLAILSYRLLVPLATETQIERSELVQIPIFLVLALGLRVLFRRRTQDWLDRRFFREAYDSERVFKELSDDVRRFTEIEPMLQTVSQRVSDTLHVAQIGFFLREGASYRLAGSTSGLAGSLQGAVFEERSSTIRNLMRAQGPVRLFREDADAWYFLAEPDERHVLDELGVELLLPIAGRNGLIGIMTLGGKQSEAAYTRSDIRMLQVLATQTGMAIEVSQLAHSLASAAAQRERMNREMEIAREVQERLFPQTLPQVSWGSIAGACRPAQEVGGDYYDVFALPHGRLGIAIGDVSGKGISAALLMASLRASLRSLMLDDPRNLARMMGKINDLVYEASAASKYASLFFCVLDPAEGSLRCVNAGHNPPVVLRRDATGAWRESRIEADGPVVGLLPIARYTEQSIQLAPGDLLLLYTDGISEAMTAEDVEWGEDGMIAAAAHTFDGTAKAAVDSILNAADRFTAGAPQHDDMTVLALKMNAAA